MREYEYELRRNGAVIATGRLQLDVVPTAGETFALGAEQVHVEDVLELGTSRRIILRAGSPIN